MFNGFNSLCELNFFLCDFQFRGELIVNAKMLTHPKNLIEYAVLLIFNYPAVVDKSSNTETLIFTAPSFQELVTIGTDKGDGSCGRWRAK